MEYKISLLSQFSQSEQDKYLTTIAGWHQQQWTDKCIETRMQQLECYRYNKEIPLMYLAHETELMGSIAINKNQNNHQIKESESASVWISNLYVDNKYRQKGVGRSLLAMVISAMKKTPCTTLYLTTNDQQQFYKNRGWQELPSKMGRSKNLSLFRYGLM